jgi:hypothetical protein
MTRFRLPLLALMTISFLLPPSAAMAQLTTRKPLVLPISGAGADGVTFEGTVAVQRFVHNRLGKVFAIGAVSGSLSGPAGPIGTTLALPVAFPVQVGDDPSIDPASLSAPDDGARVILAQATTCGVLHLELGAINLNMLGAAVMTTPVVIDINGDTGGPLGALVCEILATVNNVVGLVGLLNSLLSLVTGLLGGLTGGLGGALPL